MKDVPEISSVELHMPIFHHFPADLSKIGMSTSNDVCIILTSDIYIYI